MTGVDDGEQVARLLFFPQMVDDGELRPSAFPTKELFAKGNDGSSVDRFSLLSDPDALLRRKAYKNANPKGNRNPYGFCTGKVAEIRAITFPATGRVKPAQALDIWPDPITGNNPPDPWDHAHALIRKFGNTDIYSRANLRLVRDKLLKIFEANIVPF